MMVHPKQQPADYGTLVRESKHLDAATTTQSLKVALLSDAATQQFVPLLRTLFHRNGINAVIYEAPFGAIELQAFDANSGLYRFQPDFVVLLNSTQALRVAYASRKGSDGAAFLEARSRNLIAVWDAIQRHSSATIAQSNFVMPYERVFGNFEHKAPASFYRVTAALNTWITAQAGSQPNVLVNDVESVASWVGRRHWFDERFWDMTKAFCALEHLPAVARNIADIALATRGRIVKCVVLDLDNTLWGGVIGDDGIDGIVLNAHGEGEAFYRLQSYLKELARRGILLAVCSKNEMKNALLPFEEHPYMLLKRSDITVFVANWNDKADNIRQIRDTLNIGFDSMVFLDDNPFERNMVRGMLPGVIVPELPEDPAGYLQAISELNLFETASVSEEDLRRSELYGVEARRREAQAGFANAEEFLRSLDMRIDISPFDSFHLPRIAQLIQRSNQFNLTTHRYTAGDCDALMKGTLGTAFYVKLRDRLGDHGLIGILVLEAAGDALAIRDWLMSCRVLARGVEQYLMNFVVEHARCLGLPCVLGEYIRTAKNDMVREFYGQFGFTQYGGDEKHSHWLLMVDSYRPSITFISEVGQTVAAV